MALMILTFFSNRYKHTSIAICLGVPMITLAVMLQISFDLDYILSNDVIAYIVLFTPKQVTIFLAVYLYWFFIGSYPVIQKVRPLLQISQANTTIIDVEHLGCPLTLNAGDINVINASGNYVEIEANQTTYLKRSTLKQLQEILPDYFFQCHRSHIINLRKVTSVINQASGNGYVLLTNNHHVAVSKRCKSLLKQQLKKYHVS